MFFISSWINYLYLYALEIQGKHYLFFSLSFMKLKLYNTLTREKEEFIPLMEDPNYKWEKKDFVWMYSCWPTVYYTPHIGNLRASFSADLIRNTLKYFWYPVKAVMNITDVWHLVSDADDWEDKLEKWAKRDGISAWEVAKKYEEIFMRGLEDMNIEKFDVMPRATEHIKEQIELVKLLEEKGYTYEVPWDWIYMDTSKVDDYWKLIWPNYKKRLEELKAWERVDMKGKKNATDFALWKFSMVKGKREMERDSPWWVGFPWWHIECSAMSSKYLGEQFDIHHWGSDHITIHHPNEIAQAECWFGKKPRVKYWIHNEFLQVDWGKMSKSLWNFYSLEDIKARGYSPLDLRYFYFKAQYWNFQNFTWEALDQAKSERKGLIKKINSILESNEEGENINWKEKFQEALADNINTPKLLSELHIALAKWWKYAIDAIKELEDKILKIGLFAWELSEENQVPEDIIVLAEERKKAKSEKNYALADEIREKIKDKWWLVKDNKEWYELQKI